MVYAQLGQHPPRRASETSPKRSSGALSCLSARPPDLADAAGTRPRVVAVFLGYVPFLYCKRAASARASLRSRKGRTNFFVSRSATANDSHAVAALHVHDALAAACLSADTPLDFVKIDVEGSEARVFAVDSDMRWLRRVGVIFIETHDDMATGSAEASVRALATARMHVMKLTFRSEYALLGCSASWPPGCEQLCEQWRAHAQREGGYTDETHSRRRARGRTNDPPRCINAGPGGLGGTGT